MAKGKKIPDTEMAQRPVPMVGKAENIVMIGDTPLEIKPTKLKYLRNGTAGFYRLLETVPLVDIVQMPEGVFGVEDNRDGDKALMDWLIAATDNEDVIVKHYDEMDIGQIEMILEIFKRVNRFVDKEEKLKNVQPPRQAE